MVTDVEWRSGAVAEAAALASLSGVGAASRLRFRASWASYRRCSASQAAFLVRLTPAAALARASWSSVISSSLDDELVDPDADEESLSLSLSALALLRLPLEGLRVAVALANSLSMVRVLVVIVRFALRGPQRLAASTASATERAALPGRQPPLNQPSDTRVLQHVLHHPCHLNDERQERQAGAG